MGNQQTTRPFNQKDVDMLVKLSGKSDEEVRKWYAEFHMESEGTDRMNKRQFQIFYTKLRKNPKLDQITEHIFRAFDTDNSGTVDFNEFLLAYIATSPGSNRQKFDYAFEVFDIDADHRVERKEAQKILNIICRIIGLTEEDAKVYTETVMLSFDTDQDKVLTKEEFISGCLHDSTLGRIANPFNLQ